MTGQGDGMRVMVGITGASGALYAAALLRELAECDACRVTLVMSETAKLIVREEIGTGPRQLEDLAAETLDNDDTASWPCSGSRRFDAMAIVPCSMTTLGKLAAGIGDNVITRAGAVALKEGRKLVLVPRETPLSRVNLENMLTLASAGAVILPAMPGFYGRPETVSDLVDFVAARIMAQLGIDPDIGPRWGAGER